MKIFAYYNPGIVQSYDTIYDYTTVYGSIVAHPWILFFVVLVMALLSAGTLFCAREIHHKWHERKMAEFALK